MNACYLELTDLYQMVALFSRGIFAWFLGCYAARQESEELEKAVENLAAVMIERKAVTDQEVNAVALRDQQG